ncbi:helix-turn-helix domain-containing protein [Paenibacillus apiarius]|uniref:helix-turn-helix domain-containing protein n=1 Tax=Paenibacillus apiarius TaxID=46240 RepID=UPI003B3AE1E5
MSNHKLLGPRMAELRKKRNMTQAQLAFELKKSTSTIAMWETGHRDPDTEMMTRLSNIFGVSTDYLLGLTDTPDSRTKNAITNNDKNLSGNYHKIERFARKVSDQDLEKAVKILDAAFEHAFNEDDDDDDDI